MLIILFMLFIYAVTFVLIQLYNQEVMWLGLVTKGYLSNTLTLSLVHFFFVKITSIVQQ